MIPHPVPPKDRDVLPDLPMQVLGAEVACCDGNILERRSYIGTIDEPSAALLGLARVMHLLIPRDCLIARLQQHLPPRNSAVTT